jgi:hypothetical protein
MQLAPCPGWARPKRLLIAGIALVGASLIVANPATPALPNVQHRAVQLTAGEADWTQVLATAEDNLTTLESEAATANSDLSSAISTYVSGLDGQVAADFASAETGVQQAISGGWYGDDDGYVFGLFEGSLTDPNNGVTETGSTLQEISTALDQGNLFSAFAYFDTFSLEAFDHIVHPLLDPFLVDTRDSGVTTGAIPGELLQTLTNVYNEFFTYDNVVNFGNALLSPGISFFLGLTGDLDTIATDFSSGDYTQGLTDLENLSSDVTGDLLNGFQQTNPIDGSSEPFTGLINSGSLLEELTSTWPEQLVTALGESTAPAGAEAVTSSLPDLFSGLLSF